MLDEITVSQFIDDLVETQGSTGMPVPIENFQKTVHQYLIHPLRDRIKEVKDKASKYFEELFHQVSKLSPFYKPEDLHIRGSYLLMLQGQKPDMKDPQKVCYCVYLLP